MRLGAQGDRRICAEREDFALRPRSFSVALGPLTASEDMEAPPRIVPAHGPVSVEIASEIRFSAIGREWRDLVDRALEPNAFMEPSVVAAAAASTADPVQVLLAWGAPPSSSSIRLLGAWALRCSRPSSNLPITVLKTPVQEHACLGTPVLDRESAGPALEAMFEAIRQEPDLPKILEIFGLDEGATMGRAFTECVGRLGLGICRLDRRSRPLLRPPDPGIEPPTLSSSRQSALRRRRRRLDRLGPVTHTVSSTPGEIAAALDAFLRLESAGWKGSGIRRGRAIVRDPQVERFFRLAVTGLAADGLVTLRAMRCAERPIAMQLTIRSGTAAFTWKSAYDEEYGGCAPGLLLLQDLTGAFLSEPGLAMVDSCNHRDDGYMAEFWPERRPVTDALLAVESDALTFNVVSRIELARRWLLATARQARAVLQRRGRAATAPAAVTAPGQRAPRALEHRPSGESRSSGWNLAR